MDTFGSVDASYELEVSDGPPPEQAGPLTVEGPDPLSVGPDPIPVEGPEGFPPMNNFLQGLNHY